MAVTYGWGHDLFNSLFGWLDMTTFDASSVVADGYSGATPLALAYQGGWSNVTAHFTESQMWWGTIPGINRRDKQTIYPIRCSNVIVYKNRKLENHVFHVSWCGIYVHVI